MEKSEKTISLCAVEDVPPETALRVDVAGLPPLAVYNVEGEFFVTDDTCTHGAASLSEGFVIGDEIECPWHAGRFCVRTGAATYGPAEAPLRTYPVRIVEGRVCVSSTDAQ